MKSSAQTHVNLVLRSRRALWAAVGCAAFALMPLAPSICAAANLAVSKTQDTDDGVCDADCSLREAVGGANVALGPDTIQVPAGTYVLTQDFPLLITDSVVVRGAGVSSTFVDGNAATRVFHVTRRITVEIQDMEIRNGKSVNQAGGLYVEDAEVTLTRVAVRDCSITDPFGIGGGLFHIGGRMTLRNCLFSGNTAARGGAIFNTGNSGQMKVIDSLFTGNTALSGSAVTNYARLDLLNTTLSGNTGGNALTNDLVADVSATYSTVAANEAAFPSGIANGGRFLVQNTIVSGNSNANCTSGRPFESLGNNIDGDGTCILVGPEDQSDTDPSLGPLQNNGGPTETHALLAGSPAIDAAAAADCVSTDQRGAARPGSARGSSAGPCDIGAYEAGSAVPAAGTLEFSVERFLASEADGSVTIAVHRRGGAAGQVTVAYATANGSAEAPQDYMPESATLTWPDGDTLDKTFQVTLVQNVQGECPETVRLSLSNPGGGAVLGTRDTVELEIADDDTPAGVVSFASDTYREFEREGGNLFNVWRTQGSSGPVSVSYTTMDGTATAGDDYVASSGTLVWNGGINLAYLQLTVHNDAIFEGDETILMKLSDPLGGVLLCTPADAVLTLRESSSFDGGVLEFSMDGLTVHEDVGSATITVKRTGEPTGNITVHYLTSDGTATAGSDYTAASGTRSWPDGDGTDRSFTVPILMNSGAEGHETVLLRLDSPTGGARLGIGARAVLTVLDGQSVPALGDRGALLLAAGLGLTVLATLRALRRRERRPRATLAEP